MTRDDKENKRVSMMIALLLLASCVASFFWIVPSQISGDPPFSNNSQVNNDAGDNSQSDPSIAVNSTGTVYVTWFDNRNGDWDIFFANSTDSGVTWSNPNIRVNTEPGNTDQTYPSLAVGPDDGIYVVWQDDRNGSYDIYFSKSINGGTNWTEPNVKINTGNDTGWQSAPSIAVDSGGTIYVVWEDNRNGDWNIYFAKSIDGGDTWSDPNIRVNSANSSIQRNSKIAVDSAGTIYVTWEDDRNGDDDIYFAKSTDGGSTWTEPNIKINDDTGTSSQLNPDIAVNSSNGVYIVWQDYRNVGGDIYFAGSIDGGETWLSPNVKINSDTELDSQYDPVVDVGPTGTIYVAWQDYREGFGDIFFAYSMDVGLNWLHPNERINDDSGDNSQYDPAMVSSPANEIYVTWSDYRNTDGDIYIASRNGPKPPNPTVDSVMVDGFLPSTSEIQHIISNEPEFSFTYNDLKSDALAQYNVSLWDAGGSNVLWFSNLTDSQPSGSEITVTYNTAPSPTNGPSLEDGTTYKLTVQVQNSTGAWSTVNEVDFHLNEVLAPITPISPLQGSNITASATQTVSWTSPGADAEGNSPINYSWQVATDSDFTNIIESGSGLITESGSFDTTPSGTFYWRVNLTDGWETSSYGNQPDGYWNFTTYTPSTVNNPPSITNKASAPTTADINSTLTFTFTATDPDSDTLSWSKNSGPNWLSIGSSNGTIYGTPASSDSGSNEFTIQVSDGNGGTDSHTFTISLDGGLDGDGDGQWDWIDSTLLMVIAVIIIIIIIILVIVKARG